jgi:RNase H-fold protein (predicted Holliday junction resolvase)
MFDYISIDWGEKVCGLAFGDSTTGLVIPATFEALHVNIISVLQVEVTKRRSTHIIVGLPSNFQGNKTRITLLVEAFIEQLIKHFPTITIDTFNERGTTKDSLAKLGKHHKYQLDNQSAAEILTQYFNAHTKQN